MFTVPVFSPNTFVNWGSRPMLEHGKMTSPTNSCGFSQQSNPHHKPSSSPLINISNINHHGEKKLNNNIFEGPQHQKITFHHQRPIFSTNAPDPRCQAWPEPMESGWDCDVTLTTERQQLASRYAKNQPKATNKKQDPGKPNIPNLRSACFDATGHQSR